MKIAIIGGTGDIGEGLALRWGRDTNHEIRIGSRNSEDAEAAVADYRETLGEDEATGSPLLTGATNAKVTAGADVVVLAVPAERVLDALDEIREALTDAVVVSPAVEMSRDDEGFHYSLPSPGSTTELLDDHTPPEVPVVGAFHNVAAGRLADLDAPLDVDTLVIGDEQSAKKTIIQLATDIEGIRALDAGGLANAREVEGITPLLINLAINNAGLHDLGVKFE